MSFSETIFLFVLALIIFGPKKLPEIARQVGKVLNEFRRASNEFKAQIEQEIAHLEVEKKQITLPSNPTPEGTASRTPAYGENPATLAASADTPVVSTSLSATEAQPVVSSGTQDSETKDSPVQLHAESMSELQPDFEETHSADPNGSEPVAESHGPSVNSSSDAPTAEAPTAQESHA
jgi:sec-independent protein translocase protein TatB